MQVDLTPFYREVSFFKRIVPQVLPNFFSQNMEQKQHLNQVLLNLYFIFRALALLVDTSQMIKNQWELNIKNFISYEAIVLGMANIICHG